MEKRWSTQNLLYNFKGIDITASQVVTAKWPCPWCRARHHLMSWRGSEVSEYYSFWTFIVISLCPNLPLSMSPQETFQSLEQKSVRSVCPASRRGHWAVVTLDHLDQWQSKIAPGFLQLAVLPFSDIMFSSTCCMDWAHTSVFIDRISLLSCIVSLFNWHPLSLLMEWLLA